MNSTVRGILVLGAPHGGTGMVARILKVRLADAAVGLDGSFLRVNDLILEMMGKRWDSLALPAWEEMEELLVPCAQQARELLGAAAGKCLLLHDPRASRLLPFWRSAFAAAQAKTAFVIVVRNPLGVARELSVRCGLAPEKAYLLWLQHMVAALRDSAGQSRVVVEYEAMQADPAAQWRRIAEGLGFEAALLPAAHEEADAAPDSGHLPVPEDFGAVLEDPRADPLVGRTYQLMRRLAAADLRGGIDDKALLRDWRSVEENLRNSALTFRYLDACEAIGPANEVQAEQQPAPPEVAGAPTPLPTHALLPAVAAPDKRVSVVIPLYNHEKYITAAIHSVLAQSVPPAEIIVVDDGSSDASAEIMRKLCAQYPQIIFWSWPNQGAHHALNAAILRATGDFVAILNSDDCYLPQRLATCLDIAAADPSVDLVATALECIDAEGKAVANPWYEGALAFYRDQQDLPLALMHGNFLVSTSNFFIRRSLFERVGYFAPLRYTHDMEFCLRLILFRGKLAFVDRPLLSYRLHAANTIAEDKAREDVERAAVLAGFLHRLVQPAVLDRYVKVMANKEIVETVEYFLSLLENGLSSGAMALDRDFMECLARLGIDWVERRPTQSRLAQLVAARNRYRQEWSNPDQVAALRAGNKWLLGQRDAWEKVALEAGMQIAELNTDNAGLRQERATLTNLLKQQEDQMSAQMAQVKELADANAWLESQRMAWEQLAGERETRIGEQETRIGEQETRIGEQETRIGEQETRIGELTAQVHALLHRVGVQESQGAEQNARIAALHEERQSILDSTSWRVTSPLRFVRSKMLAPGATVLRRAFRRRPRVSATEAGLTPDAVALSELGKKHQVLLVAHQFSRSGAPRAVLYLAQALFALRGIRPLVVSPEDGPIREEFERAGFPTQVIPALFTPRTEAESTGKLVAAFASVIVTSLSAYPFMRFHGDLARHLTWWIHEEAQGFVHIAENYASDLPALFAACDAVWLGSPLCLAPAAHYVPNEKLHLLVYGCDDISMPHRPHPSGRMVFTIVGSVEPRKGQDIFLDAIELLPAELRAKAIFRIVGSPYSEWTARFHEKILARASQMAEVECIANVPFQALRELYAETDVVVCASRADPMPISITQGLMFSRACLCSSAIGHAGLLADGKDSLIFENESAAALAEKIAWAIQNSTAVTAIGVEGRQIYEKHFLMSTFVDNVKNLLQDQRQWLLNAGQHHDEN